ncbi:thioredoxin-dependent thiol peroxidase [Bacillus piscicola]|uniref:thioredoxin-dependent thiol peroxidase n=1 Tax=Bacillus piscicola TaxID=1632684 RepID=UPI001F09F934|nr:thioredoxin-dependent thiol peroxidase [Bacillus piscicola]
MTANQGETAPDFTLPASNGEKISLSDYKGKNVVLYFYPKDMTPGCTIEACDFRDYSQNFEKNNTVVLGISPDPIEKHLKFIEKHDIPFLLLADEEKQVAKAYGVWQLKKNFGKEYMGIVRSTFIIDKDGTIVKEWRNVKVPNHVREVSDYIQECIITK